jgi:hypothetical protein
MAEELSEHFNLLARAAGATEVNLEELRDSLQSRIDQQISIWVHLARTEMLNTLGSVQHLTVMALKLLPNLMALARDSAFPPGFGLKPLGLK